METRGFKLNTYGIILISNSFDSKGKLMKEIQIKISGMHCAGCASNIEKKLAATNGIKNANVSFASGSALLLFNPDIINEAKISDIITGLGFTVKTEKETKTVSQEFESEFKKTKFSFIIASIFCLPIVILSMFTGHWAYKNPLLLCLTIPVIFAGRKIFIRGLKSIKIATMDTLITIGSGAAFLISILITFSPKTFEQITHNGESYYEAAAVIITLVLMGKMLEAKAKKNTLLSLEKLINLQPMTATIVSSDGEMQISIDEIKEGDFLLVKQGEKIPVDGTITEKISEIISIDESMITGESIPVEKEIEDQVIGGTLNKAGVFKFKATKVGQDTFLHNIINIVQKAQSSKAPVQKLADRISSYFVPVVMSISTLTFLCWIIFGPTDAKFSLAIMNSIAVLVISCPCALGLATPTAIMVGSGLGAERGILFKNAEILEKTCDIKTIIFDKTGTLTIGEPKVTDIYSSPDVNIMYYAATLEKASEHPLASAIVAKAMEMKIISGMPENAKIITGSGIEGLVDNKNVLIGNEKIMRSKNIPTEICIDKYNEFQYEGKTCVFVAINNEVKGVIALADKIRNESENAIKKITELGILPVMITGDNQQNAETIAKIAGITKFYSEIKPEDKANILKEYQKEKGITAMVGDGINDAPALAQADVGIAMGTGTDIAIETADITLIRNNLTAIPDAIYLSRKTMSTIKQNLFFAFIYNIIGIPIATGAFHSIGLTLNPMIAAFAMSLSSVSVVTNSLRLRYVK